MTARAIKLPDAQHGGFVMYAFGVDFAEKKGDVYHRPKKSLLKVASGL